MTITHLFFGGIGTLVETSEMQFDAFNQAFTDNNIDFQWRRDDYIESLSSSGGQNRLASVRLDDGNALSKEMFVKVTNKEYVAKQKPDPEVYKELLHELGSDASNTLAIEDSPSGVASASDAGITTLAFPGEMTAAITFTGSEQQISSLSEAIAHIGS